MAQINTILITKQRRGVLLTLGVTFLAIVILTLATLILKHAETSEERLVELASVDRVYNLGNSLQRSLSESLYSLTEINLTVTNDTIILGRQLGAYPDPTLSTLTPAWYDYKLMTMGILGDYFPTVSRNTLAFDETDEVPNIITLSFQPTNHIYWLSSAVINQSDDFPYPHFLINAASDVGQPVYNSSYHFFVLDPSIAQGEIQQYTFYARNTDRQGVINWSRMDTSGTDLVDVRVIVDGPYGRNCYPDIPADCSAFQSVVINSTDKVFPQVIYIDNLTGDQGSENPRLKPEIRFFSGTFNDTAKNVSLNANIFLFFNYNTDMYTEFTLNMNTTYNEVYSTQLVNAQISEFSLSRLQLARIL